MKASDHFDALMRSRLRNLEAPCDPGTWESLEQRMDAGEAAFDEAIGERISALEATVPEAAWAAFAPLLDVEDTTEILENEASVDSALYAKLGNLSVPYQAGHWERMALRLEEAFVLHRHIIRQKTAEAVLMALLLISLLHFEPLFTGSAVPAVAVTGTEPAGRIEEHGQITPHLPEERTTDLASSPGLGVIEEKTSGEITPVAGITSRSFGQLPGNSLPFLPLGELYYAASGPLLSATLPVSPAGNAPLGSTMLDPGKIHGVTSYTQSALILPKAKRLPKPLEVRFSLLATADYNIVRSPEDDFDFQGTPIHTDADTTAASGYGGGILVHFKRGRWAFQTGGIYSFKRYVPNTPVLLFQTVNYYVREDFNGIQHDLLQVPLNLHYYFKNSGRWRAYTLAGVSGHFITSSVYQFDYKLTPNFSLLPPPSPPGEESTPSLKQEKDFPKGLLNGGGLSDNFYLTANIGLGLERYVSPHISVFLQPNYQHFLMDRGIGTNKDKIYTFSLHFGTRIGLR